MTTALQSSFVPKPPQPSQNSQSALTSLHCRMDKAAGARLVPMATVPPPHFLIPGAGYTLVPSLNGCDTFGGIASIHPFAGATRPITALPYYSPSSELVQQQQQQQQLYARMHGVISGVQNGTGNLSEAKHSISNVASPPSTGSTSIPPTSCDSPTTPADATTARRMSDSTSAADTPSRARKRPLRRRSSYDGTSPSELRVAMDTDDEEDVDVKEEPLADDTNTHHSCARTRRNSDSTIEESSSSKNPYPINALIDVPSSLTRSSRTSSLSSSLSSFRFGGSLSTLWASQMSLSGKVPNPNMKSTG